MCIMEIGGQTPVAKIEVWTEKDGRLMQNPNQANPINFYTVNQQYSALFERFGDSSSSVMIPKDNQAVRYKGIESFLPTTLEYSLLDYGCGLAHFLKYLRSAGHTHLKYTGVDINEKFLDHCKTNFPEDQFIDRESFFEDKSTFDYVVEVGTFNLLYSSEYDHQKLVWEEIARLWEKTRVALFLNFMSTAVDYQQTGAFHQDLGDLYAFISKRISRKIFVDSTYLPFEYTLSVWR